MGVDGHNTVIHMETAPKLDLLLRLVVASTPALLGPFEMQLP